MAVTRKYPFVEVTYDDTKEFFIVTNYQLDRFANTPYRTTAQRYSRRNHNLVVNQTFSIVSATELSALTIHLESAANPGKVQVLLGSTKEDISHNEISSFAINGKDDFVQILSSIDAFAI